MRSSSSMSARHGALLVVGGAVCAALTLGSLAPAWAGESGDVSSIDLGAFAIGDGLEAAMGEADGSFSFAVPAGGLSLAWDSRALGSDRYGLGAAWGLGLPYVDVSGGVRVFPSSGGAFQVDASAPSGLSGYAERDVVFATAEAGAPHAYELHELGGTVTFFDAAGDPVLRIAPDGGQTVWEWEAGATHRLLAVVSPDGVETRLDWSADHVAVRPGSNVDPDSGDAGVGGAWRIGLSHERVSEIADPLGTATVVGYDLAGRVDRVTAASGAETVIEWHQGDDAVATARRVSVVNAMTSAELSAREWRPVGGAGASGWPATDLTTGARGAGHTTELSDGKTRVTATFDGRQRLTRRGVTASTSAGDVVVHEQQLGYPEAGVGTAVSSKPTSSTVTYRDVEGGERVATETYELDALGRMVRRVAADGEVMTRAYDDVVPDDRRVAVGLPLREESVATDGSMTVTAYTLSDDRTAPIIAETSTATPQRAAETTARTEYEVERGFVTEERTYPGGDAGSTPVVTTRARSVDPEHGAVTVTETVAAGTASAATSSSRSSLVHGGVLSVTDAAGNSTTTEYDDAHRPVSSVDAAGHATTTTYRTSAVDGANSLTVTTPDGVAVTEVRDELGRVVERHDNIAPSGEPVDGHVRVFETRDRPAPGVEAVTDAWGATTRIEHDLFGRPVEVTLPNGLVEVTRHDDIAGTTTTGSSPTGRLEDAESTVTTTFDDEGRATGVSGSRADGRAVPEQSTTFDGFGREVAVVDGMTETEVEYDAAGDPLTTTVRPAVVDDEAAARASTPALVASRRFDGFGQSLEKTMTSGDDARSGGNRELDELGRTISETDQAGAVTRYEYTADGLVRRISADSGRITEHTYDESTRAVLETRVSLGDATAVTAYAYDERTGELLAVFDPADRSGTEVSYEYDAFGNQRAVQYPSDEPGVPGERIEHEYDRHGRKTATVDVAGNRTSFAYAADGFMTEVVQTDASGERELARVAYTPDAHGRVQRVARGNGVVTEYAFTSAGEIASETTTNGDLVTAERAYDYEPASGNLVSRVDQVLDEATGETSVERREYAYDPYGRLVGSTVRDGADAEARAVTTTAYEIGVSGQVAAETVTTEPGISSAASTTRRFGYSATGELEQITTVDAAGVERVEEQGYDERGNLVRAVDGTEYRWDAAGRQIGEIRADGTEITTAYWADGSRRSRATESGATEFYWDGSALVNEVHREGADSSEGVAAYLLGTSRHARTTETGMLAETQYYGTDRHGNVTDLTGADGVMTTTYEYSDYGMPRASGVVAQSALPGAVGDLERNPFQYASEYTHDDGTQFLQTRTYAPALMSLTSEDRESLHNLYGYADANPIMLVDPTGRMSAWDAGVLVLNSFGAASSLVGGILALTTGGLGLAFGVVAASIGLADAVWTGVETWSFVSGTKFLSDEAAIGIGAGLAGLGLGLGIAGGVAKWWSGRAAKAVDLGGPAGAPAAGVKQIPPFIAPNVSGMTPVQRASTIAEHQVTPMSGVSARPGAPDGLSPLHRVDDELAYVQSIHQRVTDAAYESEVAAKYKRLIAIHLEELEDAMQIVHRRNSVMRSETWSELGEVLQRDVIHQANAAVRKVLLSAENARRAVKSLRADDVINYGVASNDRVAELRVALDGFVVRLRAGLLQQY